STAEWKSMDFKWRSPVVPRVLLLAATLFVFCYFAFSNHNWVYALLFLGLSAYQIKLLVDYLDRSHENIAAFLNAIRFDDPSYSLRPPTDDPIVQRLHRELIDAMEKLRERRREKDSEFL